MSAAAADWRALELLTPLYHKLCGLTMIGQGRPTPSRGRFAPAAEMAARLPLRALVVLLWVAASLATTSIFAAEPALRLRIAWGGGSERQWHGIIEATTGTLAEPLPLGIEADESGSIWLEAGKLQVRARSVRAYDGVDVQVTGELSGQLIVRLWPAGSEADAKRIEIPLRQLVSDSQASPLDSQGNQLLVLRSPGDKLQFAMRRDTLVFAPGEVLSGTLQPHLLGVAGGTAVRIKAQLTSAGGTKAWNKDYDLAAPADSETAAGIPLEIKLPDAEGVYDLTLTAVHNSLRERRLRMKAIAERKVQLVIVGDKAPLAPTSESQTMARVVEIDPANPKAWDRLAHYVSTQRKEPLSSGDAARWEHPRLGSLVQVGATKESPGWEAYPLPISNPGQPHVLEIEYPSDVPQTLGISLLEPNAAGAVAPIGLDSGVYVSDEEADGPAELARHRVVFWPRTKAPLLLLTNRRANARAVYGKIRVLAVGGARRRTLAWQDANSVALGRALAKEPKPGGRLLAGYMDRPLFTENFSAPESLDAFSRRSLDDWTTFYTGAMRLVEYLHYAGYNGLMLTVMADGSTIYPSRTVQATPRHDTGVFFASGQDPVRKDVLELLLRLFDREGLALVPTVQFAAPLAELERWRHEGDALPDGLEWIGSDGNSRAVHSRFQQGLGPYYNPLNQRVQTAMLGVVSELVDRYAEHPSFRGVGVQLTADGYALLPGSDGGYDDQTIARFENEARVPVPGTGPTRFATRARILNTTAKDKWQAWRADALSGLYQQMSQVVVKARPDARLYLAGATMFDAPAVRRSLRPALPRRLKIEEVLLGLGIRPEAFDDQQIVFLRPQRIAPLESLSAQAVDLELNQASEVDRLFGGAGAASLFFHEPQRLRLTSFDAKSPFGSASTYTWLVSQFAPSGVHNRERFVHSLATLDAQCMFDGGWLLPLGQEEALRDLVNVYRELPAGKFTTISGDSQPVVIRQLEQHDQSCVYFANDSAWNVVVTVSVEMPAECRIERLGAPGSVGPVVRDPDGAHWKVSLKPYDIVAARFSTSDIKLSNPQVVVAGDVATGLERRIRDLSARTAVLANPPPLAALQNAGFEIEAADGGIVGWNLSQRDGAAANLETAARHGGKQALKLASAAGVTSLRSEPFTAPQTGRLSVAVWLRAADSPAKPTVRLALEGRLEDGQYLRFASIGGAGQGAVPITAEWSQYIFQVDDLPGEGMPELRVRFDLVGPAEVWIDDVELFDLAFSPNERVELTKIIALADLKLKSGQMSDCARLLGGYWPHFLAANVSLAQSSGSLTQKPPRAKRQEPVETAKKPSLLRGYMPRWFQ